MIRQFFLAPMFATIAIAGLVFTSANAAPVSYTLPEETAAFKPQRTRHGDDQREIFTKNRGFCSRGKPLMADRGAYRSAFVAAITRESMWIVAGTQEIAHYGLIGVRIDAYQPNADDTDSRRGLFIPNDASVNTISPIFGVQIPDRARLLFQYDYVADHLGRDVRGEPVDVPNDVVTVRAQVSF